MILIIYVKQEKDNVKLALKENGLEEGQTEGKQGSEGAGGIVQARDDVPGTR